MVARLVALAAPVDGGIVAEGARRVVEKQLVVALADVVEVPRELAAVVGRKHHLRPQQVAGAVQALLREDRRRVPRKVQELVALA